MDDILTVVKGHEIARKQDAINRLHTNLTFTVEREAEGKLPFLDMLIMNHEGELSSTWYNKPTDTGLLLN